MVTTSQEEARSGRRRTPDFAALPTIDGILGDIGIGAVIRDSVESLVGRNDNWVALTESGRRVFIKRFDDDPGGARISRATNSAEAAGTSISTPRLLGKDTALGYAVFEYLDSAESGTDLVVTGEFDEGRCADAGALVAAMHALDTSTFDRSDHPLPPMSSLSALGRVQYANASGCELAMWKIVHSDPELVACLMELRRGDTEARTVRCAIHGDIRLDQFLLYHDRLYLTDFEESRVGDPARDIGAFAGEWLYQAVVAIPTKLSDSLAVGATATHEQVVATGASEMERRSPFVRAFLRSYFHHSSPTGIPDSQFLVRSASYAGWHMIDRMIASGHESGRLSPIIKAAAGIGRTILRSPEKFVASLGLDV